MPELIRKAGSLCLAVTEGLPSLRLSVDAVYDGTLDVVDGTSKADCTAETK